MSSIKHRLLEECTLHGSAWQSIRRSTSRCSSAGCSTESLALAFLPPQEHQRDGLDGGFRSPGEPRGNVRADFVFVTVS